MYKRQDLGHKKEFEAKFFGKAGKKMEIANEAQANEILSAVQGKPFFIESVKKGTKQKRSFAPFTTSSLQQLSLIHI